MNDFLATGKGMGLSIKPDEVDKIEHALKAWFASQGLTPHDAAYVMAHLAGIIIGIGSSDAQHIRAGLQALCTTMTNVAAQVYNKSPKRT